jgi:histidine ammonia-lyase
MPTLEIDGQSLTIADVVHVARRAPGHEAPSYLTSQNSGHDGASEVVVRLSAAAQGRVQRARELVERFVQEGRIVYGVTTGFGALKDQLIGPEHILDLQRNLIMSHAAGVGEPLPEEAVRAMILVRANALAAGYSGLRLETLEALLELLNRGVHPIVPAQGSVGASGDLAPLAHIALVLIGLGEAMYRGERLPGSEALRRAGLAPIVPAAKEGLALTNGTAMQTALGALLVHDAARLCQVADIAGALSLEALQGVPEAFDPRLHAVRPHPGQQEVAAHVRRLIAGSTLVCNETTTLRARALKGEASSKVQDPYCLRCLPQVHGAVRDAVAHARRVVEIELNAATDNPLIFGDGTSDEAPSRPPSRGVRHDGASEAVALSGGNFHGQPIAMALDFLGLAGTVLGNISERRIDRLLNSGGLLPRFLVGEGGFHSGLMLVQYTAAALASENKVLAHPASADSIPTSAGFEDFVSMGPHAARKGREILRNVASILAGELLVAAQGVDLRRRATPEARLGSGSAVAYRLVRERVPFLEGDAVLAPLLAALQILVADDGFVAAVEAVAGGL